MFIGFGFCFVLWCLLVSVVLCGAFDFRLLCWRGISGVRD